MAAGQAQLVIGKRTKMIEMIDRVKDFLYEEGSHTSKQLADHFEVSEWWMADILGYMRAEGLVAKNRRDNTVYWILYEDAIAA